MQRATQAVYETFNPGSIIRVLAAPFGIDSASAPPWAVLWEGLPQCRRPSTESRAFTPPIHQCLFATNVIRLEFDSRVRKPPVSPNAASVAP